MGYAIASHHFSPLCSRDRSICSAANGQFPKDSSAFYVLRTQPRIPLVRRNGSFLSRLEHKPEPRQEGQSGRRQESYFAGDAHC